MTDIKRILKNAFIDAFGSDVKTEEYEFSSFFEYKMNQLIKANKGINRLFNTTGKKIVCIAVAALIALTTVACSVKEVRETVIQKTEEFIVNVKEKLQGTYAAKLSDYLPEETVKIIQTSYISEVNRQYVISGKEQIEKFLTVLSETPWAGAEKYYDDDFTVNTYYSFDFYNSAEDCTLRILMCNDINSSRARIVLDCNGEMHRYYISNDIYNKLLAFTTETYYLHNSNLKLPAPDIAEKYKENALSGLEGDEKQNILNAVRDMHYRIEIFLLNNVSDFKYSDSIYWKYLESGEIFNDPITGEENRYTENRFITDELNTVILNIKDEKTKQIFEKALEIWNVSVSEHNISGLFKVHEYIHDCDYFAFNYPTKYVYDERADYQGLDDYFGTLS